MIVYVTNNKEPCEALYNKYTFNHNIIYTSVYNLFHIYSEA